MDEVIAALKKKMQSTLESYKSETARVRTGRASANLVSGVMVEYYGTPTPLNQLATLSVPEPQLIVVQPFDLNSLGDIERAIHSAELGLNPANDGKIIRVPVPPLTEERRREMVKLVRKMAEEHKVALRNVRREGNDRMKGLEKKKEITEDDLRKGQGDVQKLTDQFVSDLDGLLSAKEKEILEV